MRDTPPFCTLLTYFVPSGMITSPSLPACAACSVFSSLASGENVRISSVPMFTTTMLPLRVDGDAVRLPQRRALHEDRGGAVAA